MAATSDLPKLSAPAQRALAGAGLTTLKQVARHTETEIKQLHGVGPTTITALQAALKAQGLAFKPEKKK